MGHLAVWKIQEEMIAELRKIGIAIPDKVMNDLKMTVTLIRIPKMEEPPEEAQSDIETYLANVESFIITEAEKHLGSELANKWLRKLSNASKTTDRNEDQIRFVTGLPRDQKWIRIKPTGDLPLGTLKTMADESKLRHRTQQNQLLVYGEDKSLKAFVGKMAAKQSAKKP